MGPIFASILRVLMIGSVGYSAADLLNWFQAKREGQEVPTIGKSLIDVFLSWRFLIFLGILVVGIYVFLVGRFRKTQITSLL